MKKKEILDVLYRAHTEGHHVQVKFNFGISPTIGSTTRTSVFIDAGIFKISSVDNTAQETVFKGTIHSGYCLKEICISPMMIHNVTRV